MSYMQEAGQRLNLSPAVLQSLKNFIWLVIDEHKEDEFTLKVWFFHKTFKIKDLYGVFQLVLGPPPVIA